VKSDSLLVNGKENGEGNIHPITLVESSISLCEDQSYTRNKKMMKHPSDHLPNEGKKRHQGGGSRTQILLHVKAGSQACLSSIGERPSFNFNEGTPKFGPPNKKKLNSPFLLSNVVLIHSW